MRASLLLCLGISCGACATAELYTLSLHDALPICSDVAAQPARAGDRPHGGPGLCEQDDRLGPRDQLVDRGLASAPDLHEDRKGTRLNSSQMSTSYAVFSLNKKTCPPSLPSVPTSH